MKFLPLILRNALRNKRRSILTVLSIASSLFVLAVMMNILTAMSSWEGQADTHHRAVVQSSVSLATPLPLSMETDLKALPQVEVLQKLNWFGGYYQDPRNFFANFAVDPEVLLAMWDEYRLPEEEFREFLKNRTSCVVGRSLLDRLGLKKGQRMTLIGTIYPFNVDLEIVGVYRAPTPTDEEAMYFQWGYFDELNRRRGTVGTYWLKARKPEDVAALKETIDARYRDSSDPTVTLTEKEFAAQFQQMMGNVKGLVTFMGSVIVVVLILLAANTMAMSARERVVEVAVMRTLGFQPGRILALFLGESVFVALIGAAAASAGAHLLFNAAGFSPAPQFFPYLSTAPGTVLVLFLVAVGVGLASAAIPALRAASRPIVEGLRFVG